MAQNAINGTYGIVDKDWEIIKQILALSKAVEEALLFGSRAKGTYKTGLDIDLVIKGPSITKKDISLLMGAFEESLLPYFVDVISYSNIKNEALKEHIDRVGVTVYSAVSH